MPGALGMLLAAALASATPTTAARPALDLIVVLEPGVSVGEADLREVAAAVRAVWRPAADVALKPDLVCGAGAPNCLRTSVGRETVTLVLTTRVRRGVGPALGWVDFVESVPQPVVTVSVAEVAQLMHDGRWQGRALDTMPGLVRQQFMRRAIACAVAHELGHYLLRSTAHTRRGLMQANFTVDDIMDPETPVGRITRDEIARVLQRAPLAARAED